MGLVGSRKLISISFLISDFAHIFTFVFHFGVIDGWTHVYIESVSLRVVSRKVNEVVLPIKKETFSNILQMPDFHSFQGNIFYKGAF